MNQNTKAKARSEWFNEVRQCAYVLGAEGRRFLFKQLGYKGYKLTRRSKLRVYAN